MTTVAGMEPGARESGRGTSGEALTQRWTVISDGGGGRVVTRVRSGASARAKVLVRRVSRRQEGTGCRAPRWEPWLAEPLAWEADARTYLAF